MNNIEKDPLLKKIEISNWIILAVIFIPCLIFAPFNFALGVLLGGFISIINFFWLGQSLQNAFKNLGGKGNIKGPVMVKYYIRLAITAVVLYFLITGGIVNVVALLIGLSVVVINIIFTVVITVFSKKNFLEEVS
ncbi:MAG TPA: ATP synthase subunit I [Smithellaceae bacterium]|nr:ATP synthase subunit I [Smithellaceae bacterium]